MFVGVVKTRDILLHPLELIRIRGFKGYFKLLWRALKRRRYAFIGMTQESDWIYDKKVRVKTKTDPKFRNNLVYTSKTKSASK